MNRYCYTCMNELTEGDYCSHCMRENVADDVVYRLSPGTVLNNRYLIGNCIGEGGFGITYIGRDLMLDMKVAVKEYYPTGYVNRNNTVNQQVTASTESQKTVFYKGKERFLEEARRIAKFAGEPGIVGVRDYFELNGTAYIIMDYLDGINLATYIKTNGLFAPEQIFGLMLPIVRSLRHMHETGLIHRDISPDNVMYLRNGTLVLMDFGSARYFSNGNKEMSVLLKQGYAPEEQYRTNGDQGPWTDVYGLCATMYRCITGVIPVDALDRLRSDSLVPPSQMGIAIPQAMEVVLMYGLAVFKENRCQNMDELGSLMEKALAHRPVTVDRRPDEYAAVNRSMAADGYYKERVTNDMGGYGSVPPQGGYGMGNMGYTGAPAPQKGPNKGVIAAVISVSALIIIATVGILLYLFVFKDKTPDAPSVDQSTVSSDTSQASSSSAGSQTGELTLKVPSCEKMSFASAKSELENAGFAVKTEYEYSSSVAKDCVISQSVSAGSEAASGTVITLVVSKGEEPCPYDYEQKLTVTASPGSSYADATLYEWKDGDWSEMASYSATVGRNGIGNTSEGSSTSPIGIHKLGVILAHQSVNTNMNVYQVTSQTGVVSDTDSSYYNQIMESYEAPSLNKFDLLNDEFSNFAIFIEFNGNGFSSEGVVRGGGSAISVRGKSGSLSPTAGDVDISSGDMQDLISKLDANKNPVIELTVD